MLQSCAINCCTYINMTHVNVYKLRMNDTNCVSVTNLQFHDAVLTMASDQLSVREAPTTCINLTCMPDCLDLWLLHSVVQIAVHQHGCTVVPSC